MTPLRTALIGVGARTPSATRGGGHQIGYTHAGAYAREPRTCLVAAADISPTNLHAFQGRFGETAVYGDYREMLQKERPDLVSVCTYVGLHYEMLEACAEADVRGVVCEKPFVNSPAELSAVRRLVDETGLKIVVTHIRRYLPAFRAAAKAYQEGRVGRPVAGLTGLEGWDLSEMGSHHFDLLRMFNGDRPVRFVMGQARVTDAKGYGHAMEDHAVAYFEFENGSRGVVDGGRAMNVDGFSLVGTEGFIHIRDERQVEIVDPAGREVQDYSADPGSTWEVMWDCLVGSMVDWLEGGPEPEGGFQNASQSAELNLAAYVSMIRGDRVDLPLDDALDEWPVDALARRNVERRSLTALT